MQAYTDPLSGLPTDSSAFRQKARRIVLSDDPDTATQQTVGYMTQYAHEAARDPLLHQLAVNAVRSFRGGPGWVGKVDFNKDPFTNPMLMADSVWWWCKHNLRFKHHGEQFEAWSGDLGDPRTKLQLLIAPDVLVRMKRMEGDCAIYTMMLCAMLEALGLDWQIRTLAVDRRQPGVFSHVCARSQGETLDASHGKYPGWEVPAYDVQRSWTFNSNGVRVADGGNGMGRFTGLHDYRQSRYASRGGRRGMWGMGDFCDDYPAECGQTDPNSTTLPYYDATQIFTANPSGATPTPYSGTVYTAPAQNSAQWASFASTLLKSGLTLAEINAIQPGTVVGANGAILRQNPGYSVPAPGTTSLNTALGGNNMLYFGLAAVAVLLLMGKR